MAYVRLYHMINYIIVLEMTLEVCRGLEQSIYSISR